MFLTRISSAMLLCVAVGLQFIVIVSPSEIGLAKAIPVEIEEDVVDQQSEQGGSNRNGKTVLPGEFLGTWDVQSVRRRTKNPGVEKRFNVSMHNVLIISGRPGQYYLGSSTGFQSPITIDNVAGGTATLRSEQGEQYEFGELVKKKTQILTLKVARDGKTVSGSFKFDLIFGSGEHILVNYSLSGHKMS